MTERSRLCPHCPEHRPIPPSHRQNRIYSCSRCWYYKHKARVKKYRATAKGRMLARNAQRRYWNTHEIGKRRLRLSGRYVGIAKTVADARRIRAVAQRLMGDFRQRQREERMCHFRETAGKSEN